MATLSCVLDFSPRSNNCFGNIFVPSNSRYDSGLSFNQSLSWSLSCAANNRDQLLYITASVKKRDRILEPQLLINSMFARKNGLEKGDKVFLTQIDVVERCIEVYLEPESVDDWEFIESFASAVEDQLLQQCLLVWRGMLLPIWIDNKCFSLRVDKLKPASVVVHLQNQTQCLVAPRDRRKKIAKLCDKEKLLPAPLISSSVKTQPLSTRTVVRTPISVYKRVLAYLLNLFARLFYGRTWLSWQHELVAQRSLMTKTRLSQETAVVLRVCDSREIEKRITTPRLTLNADVVLKLEPRWKSAREDGTWWLAELKRMDLCKSKQVASEVTSLPQSVWSLVRLCDSNEAASSGLILPNYMARQLSVLPGDHVVVRPAPHSFTGLRKLSLTVDLDAFQDKVIASALCDTAFRSWVNQNSSIDEPLLIYQNMLLEFHIDMERTIKCVINFTPSKGSNEHTLNGTGSFCLLTKALLDDLKVDVKMITNKQEWPWEKEKTLCHRETVKDNIVFDHLKPLFDILDQTTVEVRNCSARLVLITGPEGSGRSTLLRAAGERFSFNPHGLFWKHLSCKSMKGKAAESVARIFDTHLSECLWRSPALITLDDLDSLAPNPEDSAVAENPTLNVHVEKLASVFESRLRALRQPRLRENTFGVLILVTSLSAQSLHPLLSGLHGHRLYHHQLIMPVCNQALRLQLLRNLLWSDTALKEALSVQQYATLADCARCAEACGMADLVLLVERARMLVEMRFQSVDVKRNEEVLEALQHTLQSFTPMALRGVDAREDGIEGYADVGGLQEAKSMLLRTLLWPVKYPRLRTRCGIRPRSGVLLVGASGCGKSLLAVAAVREAGLRLLTVKGAELLSKYIGASEAAVRDLFSRARRAAPCVIFFDEFEALAPRRGRDSTGVTDRVVNQLLTQLDGIEPLEGVALLAASNRPDLIDPALLRPGRIDSQIVCALPDAEERYEIFLCLCRLGCVRLAVNVDDTFLRKLAASTDRFSGANLKGLLYNAQLNSLRRNDAPDQVLQVSREDLELALRDSQPSLFEDWLPPSYSTHLLRSRDIEQQRVTLA